MSGNGNSAIQDFQDLSAWQRGMDFVHEVYVASRKWPLEEMQDGMTNQIRAAVIAIPASIAKGFAFYPDTKEFLRHVDEAYGKLMVVETYLLLAKDLGFGSPDETEKALESASTMARLLDELEDWLQKGQLPPTTKL